jgi:hypothetical protein
MPTRTGIVHADPFVQHGHTRRTIIAINPSRQCWEAAFPRGAAGVLLMDGQIVVGDGDCLAHDTVLDLASIDRDMEEFRLQMYSGMAVAEIWLEDAAGLMDCDEQVHEAVRNRYGRGLDEIEAKVRRAVERFMPDAAVRAIPKDMDGTEPLLASDREFLEAPDPAARRAMAGGRPGNLP